MLAAWSLGCFVMFLGAFFRTRNIHPSLSPVYLCSCLCTLHSPGYLCWSLGCFVMFVGARIAATLATRYRSGVLDMSVANMVSSIPSWAYAGKKLFLHNIKCM